MRNRFDEQLATLNKELIEMGALCEEAIAIAAKALTTADKTAAEKVDPLESEINQKERDIETLCLKMLLQQQPVAKDLRQISAALKMITDLERIADQAADISEISLQFKGEAFIKEPEHIEMMAKIVSGMVKDGVSSYINRDLELAKGLDKRDDRVDELFETVKRDLVDLIMQNPTNADQAILFMMIAKYLERIGDHAVNIGEWVEYASTGVRR